MSDIIHCNSTEYPLLTGLFHCPQCERLKETTLQNDLFSCGDCDRRICVQCAETNCPNGDKAGSIGNCRYCTGEMIPVEEYFQHKGFDDEIIKAELLADREPKKKGLKRSVPTTEEDSKKESKTEEAAYERTSTCLRCYQLQAHLTFNKEPCGDCERWIGYCDDCVDKPDKLEFEHKCYGSKAFPARYGGHIDDDLPTVSSTNDTKLECKICHESLYHDSLAWWDEASGDLRCEGCYSLLGISPSRVRFIKVLTQH